MSYTALEQKREKAPTRELGKWKGQIWMADDFDEPLQLVPDKSDIGEIKK